MASNPCLIQDRLERSLEMQQSDRTLIDLSRRYGGDQPLPHRDRASIEGWEGKG